MSKKKKKKLRTWPELIEDLDQESKDKLADLAGPHLLDQVSYLRRLLRKEGQRLERLKLGVN